MDVTPPHWNRSNTYQLSVAASGEEAELTSVAHNVSSEEVAPFMRHADDSFNSEHRGIAASTPVNANREMAFITQALDELSVVLGGVVLYVKPDNLEMVRQLYPNGR